MVIDVLPLLRAGQHALPAVAGRWAPVFLYITPDQVLPITSVLGAILGVLLMFWNKVLGVARRVWTLFSRKK